MLVFRACCAAGGSSAIVNSDDKFLLIFLNDRSVRSISGSSGNMP